MAVFHLCAVFNEHSISDVCFPSLFSSSLFFSTTGDYILDAKPKEISEAQRLNYEQVRSSVALLFSKHLAMQQRFWLCVFRNLTHMRVSLRKVSCRNEWSGGFSEIHEGDGRRC